jgi:hypothetical protein
MVRNRAATHETSEVPHIGEFGPWEALEASVARRALGWISSLVMTIFPVRCVKKSTDSHIVTHILLQSPRSSCSKQIGPREVLTMDPAGGQTLVYHNHMKRKSV